jgi:hypothetical protein
MMADERGGVLKSTPPYGLLPLYWEQDVVKVQKLANKLRPFRM